mmetsp:Transcript_3647/g.5353  ORF Transcript_3647/g.5353 Transcript_3647/m.5353 type:complete len:122 (-) Transcript_3647:59-424(-)
MEGVELGNEVLLLSRSERASGAILVRLVLGQFGALVGLFGLCLEPITWDGEARCDKKILETAQQCGFSLEYSIEGLEATQNSSETQQKFAKRLDKTSTSFYPLSLSSGDHILKNFKDLGID